MGTRGFSHGKSGYDYDEDAWSLVFAEARVLTILTDLYPLLSTWEQKDIRDGIRSRLEFPDCDFTLTEAAASSARKLLENPALLSEAAASGLQKALKSHEEEEMSFALI